MVLSPNKKKLILIVIVTVIVAEYNILIMEIYNTKSIYSKLINNIFLSLNKMHLQLS